MQLFKFTVLASVLGAVTAAVIPKDHDIVNRQASTQWMSVVWYEFISPRSIKSILTFRHSLALPEASEPSYLKTSQQLASSRFFPVCSISPNFKAFPIKAFPITPPGKSGVDALVDRLHFDNVASHLALCFWLWD
ncbi:hypothetical protein C8R47DRAFT_1302771 [Mycena vitilis]|nr:hypothetical protein C8R47DRAFT_1302771 [Mycena vitilis]